MAALTPIIMLVFKAEGENKSFQNPQPHPTHNSADFGVGLFSQNWVMRPPLAGKGEQDRRDGLRPVVIHVISLDTESSWGCLPQPSSDAGAVVFAQ